MEIKIEACLGDVGPFFGQVYSLANHQIVGCQVSVGDFHINVLSWLGLSLVTVSGIAVSASDGRTMR